jgi:DNA-directed RNA polymerase specialized sigma24 family protein
VLPASWGAPADHRGRPAGAPRARPRPVAEPRWTSASRRHPRLSRRASNSAKSPTGERRRYLNFAGFASVAHPSGPFGVYGWRVPESLLVVREHLTASCLLGQLRHIMFNSHEDGSSNWSDAIRLLEGSVRRLLRHKPGVDDVIQNACLRLLKAQNGGLNVESPTAFLLRIAGEEVAKWIRSTRKWSAQCDDGQISLIDLVSFEVGLTAMPIEEGLERLAASLPREIRGWLLDKVSGLSDGDLANRDGVQEVSIRKRWSRLEAYLRRSGYLGKILDPSVTILALRDLTGRTAASPTSNLQPPTSNLQPPTSNLSMRASVLFVYAVLPRVCYVKVIFPILLSPDTDVLCLQSSSQLCRM